MHNREYELSQELFTQIIEGETILLDGVTENYFALNDIATIFWDSLKKHNDLINVYNELLELFDVDEKLLENDLEGFVKELEKKEFIKFDEK